MNKKFIITMFVIFVININSQELDTTFLESLPDDIKDDLIQQNGERNAESKSNYKPFFIHQD